MGDLCNKKTLQEQIAILVAMFFALKFLQSTPFETYFFKIHAVFLGVMAIYLIFYVASFSIRHNHMNNIVRYFLIIIAVVPFYSACRANIEFGQPYIMGILSERNMLAIGVGIWFYRTLVTKKFTFTSFEFGFVLMAWISLTLFCSIALLYEPGKINANDEFVRMTLERGLRFKFQYYFITFGAIYYIAKYSVAKKFIYIVFSLIFISYILLIVKGRTYIITMAITLLWFFWFHFEGKKMVYAINLMIFLSLGALCIQTAWPEYFEHMGYLFTQMLTAFVDQQSQDMSAHARINETRVVLTYFNLHPLSLLFGIGKISNQWRNGYESIFGYFFPEDIGFLGGIFIYGITGLIFLCLVPLVISIRILKKVHGGSDAFITALKYLLIFSLVGTIQGSFYFNAIDYIIPLFLLLAHKNINAYSSGKGGPGH